MAYLVSKPDGRWELRRSRLTPAGPRSETLVGFKELTPELTAQAVEKSGGELSAAQVHSIALRGGAPVAPDPTHRAAAELIGELASGASLPRGWGRAIVDLIDGGGGGSDAEAIAEWAGAGLERRGEALHDLLLLGDAIPHGGRQESLAFPGFSTEGVDPA